MKGAANLLSFQWLQSNQQADLFDNFFVRMNPSYLTRLSAIVMLSVGVTVTSSLRTNTTQRLAWLDVVLQNVNPRVSHPFLPESRLCLSNWFLPV